MYEIIYSPRAKEDLIKLQRSEPAAFKKAGKFIEELKVHPKTGYRASRTIVGRP